MLRCYNIESLNIAIQELEHMDDVGYVKGMMSIFSDTLGKLDIYKRSLHCTDLKRVVRRYLDERH